MSSVKRRIPALLVLVSYFFSLAFLLLSVWLPASFQAIGLLVQSSKTLLLLLAGLLFIAGFIWWVVNIFKNFQAHTLSFAWYDYGVVVVVILYVLQKFFNT